MRTANKPPCCTRVLLQSDDIPGEFATGERPPRPFTRAFDLLCATVGLILLSPVLLIIALAIKIEGGGPVFYRQQRMGRNFRPFWLFKFRTMVVGAEKNGLLTTHGDARVTRVGAHLRRYKLDELPQLFNVIRGDMQIVGPRPEVSRYVELFRPQYALMLREVPGITDPASIAFRQEDKVLSSPQAEEQYVGKILPQKLSLSLAYQSRRCFSSDLKVILQTIFSIA